MIITEPLWPPAGWPRDMMLCTHVVNMNELPDLEYFEINGTYAKKKKKFMSMIYFFLPKPELAFALCHIMEAVRYCRQPKGFVAGWILWKQMHGIWGGRCSLETGTQEGKAAGLGRGRG